MSETRMTPEAMEAHEGLHRRIDQLERELAAAMKELAAIRTQLHEAIELRDAAEYKALHREAMYEQRNELLRSLQAAAMAADARAERAEAQLAERDAELAAIKVHAEAMAEGIESSHLEIEQDALAAYRADFPEDAK